MLATMSVLEIESQTSPGLDHGPVQTRVTVAEHEGSLGAASAAAKIFRLLVLGVTYLLFPIVSIAVVWQVQTWMNVSIPFRGQLLVAAGVGYLGYRLGRPLMAALERAAGLRPVHPKRTVFLEGKVLRIEDGPSLLRADIEEICVEHAMGKDTCAVSAIASESDNTVLFESVPLVDIDALIAAFKDADYSVRET